MRVLLTLPIFVIALSLRVDFFFIQVFEQGVRKARNIHHFISLHKNL